MNAANFADRRTDSQKAKDAMLAKFRERTSDPEMARKRAEAAERAKQREERRALAEMVRQERLEAERKEKEAQRVRDAEAAEEARLLAQAAADIRRAEWVASQKTMLQRQEAALQARKARK